MKTIMEGNSWLKPAFSWALAVGGLLFLFGRALSKHVRGGLDPFWFADDARNQVMPYLRWVEPAAFARDFVGDYGLDTIPWGLRVLFWFGSFFIDPLRLSEILPYVLLGVTAAAAARAAARLSPAGVGGFAAFATAALIIGSDIYLERMAGTLPRALCYPLVALGLMMLVEGRVRSVMVVATVGALFYPTASVLLAGGVFTLLFVLPKENRGSARDWPWPKRLAILGGLAVAIALFTAPTLLATAKYGPRVKPDNLASYPEGGPGGTHGSDDRPPYKGLPEEFIHYASRGLFGSGDPFVPVLRRKLDQKLVFDVVLVAALIGVMVGGRHGRRRRFAGFVLGVAFAHLLARVLAPYLYAPSRFAMYSVPLILAVMVPVGTVSLFAHRVARRPRMLVAATSLTGLLLVLGGHGSTNAGLTVRIDDEQRGLYAFVRSLPPEVLVAGWPDEAMSSLPYVGRRRAFMTGEIHMGYHVGFLELVRKRLIPFFEAYLSPDVDTVRRFRDEWGVTHILVERAHFHRRSRLYMPPYGERIRALWRGLGRAQPAVLSNPSAVVFQSHRYVLVDLDRL